MQDAAGDGRFLLGLGASKIFMKEIGEGEKGKDVGPAVVMRESIEIIQAMLAGEAVDYHGKAFDAIGAGAERRSARLACTRAHLRWRDRPGVAEAGGLAFRWTADGQHHHPGFRALCARQHGRRREESWQRSGHARSRRA